MFFFSCDIIEYAELSVWDSYTLSLGTYIKVELKDVNRDVQQTCKIRQTSYEPETIEQVTTQHHI